MASPSGSYGRAADTQVGPISFKEKLDKQDEVFKASASFLFKHVRVVRLVDVPRNTLVYLSYSDKIIDVSPKNSVTTVLEELPIPVK